MRVKRSEMQGFLERILSGETVDFDRFSAREDFVYAGTKRPDGQPDFHRVLRIGFHDENYWDDRMPLFDGTVGRLEEILVEHGVEVVGGETSEAARAPAVSLQMGLQRCQDAIELATAAGKKIAGVAFRAAGGRVEVEMDLDDGTMIRFVAPPWD